MRGLGAEKVSGSRTEIGGTPPLSDREFELFQRLIYEQAGIDLTPGKRALLVARLVGRLRALNLSSFSAYFSRVSAEGDLEERQRMLDCISTNETHFFREPKHFEFLEQTVIPAWIAAAQGGQRARSVRVWSAACSTGEEPFSIAMLLLHHLPPAAGWSIEVFGSDISTRVLERARNGIYSIERASEIPTPYLKAFMLKGIGTEREKMKVDDVLQSVVRFRWMNLNAPTYDVVGRFDLIFCRNVLIYFNEESRKRTIGRLLNHLAPEGYFFVGHAENLNSVTSDIRSVSPSVYTFPRARADSARSVPR